MPLPALTLVGPGRAGRALARSWLLAGGRVEGILARTEAAARAACASIGAGPSAAAGALGTSRFRAEVLALAVPDDALEATAREAASHGSCELALHLSGALPAEALAPLSSAGALVASVHPLRAFHGSPGEDFRGAFVAVEGDAAARAKAIELAEALGARPHPIAKEAKVLYHAGATLAAGGSVAVLSAATRAWGLAGIPEQDARPALAGLAASAVAAAGRLSFSEALTGPVARRDLETIRAHAAALAGQPDLLRLYVLLALETVARTPEAGREKEVRALLAC